MHLRPLSLGLPLRLRRFLCLRLRLFLGRHAILHLRLNTRKHGAAEAYAPPHVAHTTDHG